MKTSLTNGLPVEKKKELISEFSSSGILRERLVMLLKKKIESTRTKCRLELTYDSPNWSLVQADSIGYERALTEAISLIQN